MQIPLAPIFWFLSELLYVRSFRKVDDECWVSAIWGIHVSGARKLAQCWQHAGAHQPQAAIRVHQIEETSGKVRFVYVQTLNSLHCQVCKTSNVFFFSVYCMFTLDSWRAPFFRAWTVLDWWIGTGHSAPSWGFWDQTFCICFLFLLLIVSPDALALLTFWHKLVMSLEARKADQQICVMVEQFGGRHSMHRDEAWTTTLRSLAAKLLKATFAHPTM